MIHGKQIQDDSVTEGKLADAYTAEVVKRDGSVALTGNLNADGNRVTSLAAPQSPQDAARLQDIRNRPQKEAVVAASTGNLTLSGTQTIDGVSVIAGDRVLAKNQTAAEENGIYVVASSAWSRTSDADSTEELYGAVVYVRQGTTNEATRWGLQTDDVTVDTTEQTWVDLGDGSGEGSDPSTSNKEMSASETTSDGDQACATAISATPSGYVMVLVNKLPVWVGNNSAAAYFSGDSGSTARAQGSIQSSDTLHWNGTVAGYQLATSDVIDFVYNT